MTEVQDFQKSLEKGEAGEIIVAAYLAGLPHVVGIDDKTKDEEYQKKDIDFLILNRDGYEWSAEVKTDYTDTGNFFYETVSCDQTGSLGCMEKTEAQWLAYYFYQTGRLYWFHMQDFRAWFHAHKDKERAIQPRKAWNNGYKSSGYIIPIKMLERENPRWMRFEQLEGADNHERV